MPRCLTIVAIFTLAAFCCRANDVAFAEDSLERGKQLFGQHCAACHGDRGEGTDEYENALIGDLAVSDLAKYIDKQMPVDDPKTIVGDDATAVARFAYESFYSPIAQARNQPARVELAHLTVEQYRQSLADVIGGFRWRAPGIESRGLKAEFFNADRHIRENKKVHERIDSRLHFERKKGDKVDGFEKLSEEQFALRWSGGLWVEETGFYEFTVRTENGARLWINDSTEALIDVWVKSGPQNEFTAGRFLLAGRVYPLRVEMLRSKKEKLGFIEVDWKAPGRPLAAIPARNLIQGKFPELYISSSPFPPDDRSRGYLRGSSVSKEWNEATTSGALEAMMYVTTRLNELAKTRTGASDRNEKVRAFCEQFTQRAFRRSLSDEDRAFYIDRQFRDGSNADEAVKRVVLLTLKSPHFLYRRLHTNDDFARAAEISYGLWDSIPDEELTKAAAKGELKTRQQVERQLRRMLPDLRTQAKTRSFFHSWLNLDAEKSLDKDDAIYPEFNEQHVADLRTSLDLMIEKIMWSDGADFRSLFSGESILANQRLAKYYGANPPSEPGFHETTFKDQQRAGILTHPLLMADFAYFSTTSPIHRGVFVAKHLLGRTLNPPPESFSPLSPDLHPDLTTRERTIKQTSPETCQHCHSIINPLGFSLEHFDAAGRYQTVDHDKPIDTHGHYQPPGNDKIEFSGARDLAKFLATSQESQTAFIDEMFHFYVKQPIRAFGEKRIELLHQEFAKGNFDMQNLLMNVVATAATESPAE